MDAKERRQRVEQALDRRVQNLFPSREDVVARLSAEQPLTVYLGIDPTGPHIHMGHTIPMLLLSDLAELGHDTILLIGDFTARIGDPTDKSATRSALTSEQIQTHMETYALQAHRILPKEKIRIAYNSEWFGMMTMEQVIRLTSRATVQQMMQRDMFQERIKTEKPIYVSEFLYPLMQGYDSVALRTDGEIGGNDQMFNMLVGRELEKEILGKDKIVLATRLLVDEATGKKMSKSEGPLISIDDSPQEIRRKVLAMDDGMIETICRLCTQKEEDWIQGQLGDPRAFKEALASELVRMYHGEEGVVEARQATEVDVKGLPLDKGLVVSGVRGTMSAAHRLIDQGATEVNGETIKEWKLILKPGDEIQVGKGKTLKVK